MTQISPAFQHISLGMNLQKSFEKAWSMTWPSLQKVNVDLLTPHRCLHINMKDMIIFFSWLKPYFQESIISKIQVTLYTAQHFIDKNFKLIKNKITGPLCSQSSQKFCLLHVTLRQNTCKSSSLLVTLHLCMKVNIIQTGLECSFRHTKGTVLQPATLGNKKHKWLYR